MAVYVDELVEHPLAAIAPAARRFGRLWCHMLADTEQELHAFAVRIGMKRAWCHVSRSGVPHYDLTPGRRQVALAAGALEWPEGKSKARFLREFRERHGIAI